MGEFQIVLCKFQPHGELKHHGLPRSHDQFVYVIFIKFFLQNINFWLGWWVECTPYFEIVLTNKITFFIPSNLKQERLLPWKAYKEMNNNDYWCTLVVLWKWLHKLKWTSWVPWVSLNSFCTPTIYCLIREEWIRKKLTHQTNKSNKQISWQFNWQHCKTFESVLQNQS